VRRSVTLLAAFTLVASMGSHARAQSDDVARLRARATATPDDASVRCELAFALVRIGAHAEARQEATAGIAAIARPLTSRTRRTLAACLYNRGRAEEGLSQRRDAVADYVASLALRPNDAVRARIDAIVPNVPASCPAAALVAFDPVQGTQYEMGLRPDQNTPSVRTANGVVWCFVAGGYGMTLSTYAVAVRADGTAAVVAEIDEWSQEDSTAPIEMEAARAVPELSSVAGAMVRVAATGGGNCGSMNGFEDFEHHATVFVGLVGDAIRTHVIVTRQYDCLGTVSASLRIRGGNVEITHSHRRRREVETLPIASILQ
jgi:hypothetical protein